MTQQTPELLRDKATELTGELVKSAPDTEKLRRTYASVAEHEKNGFLEQVGLQLENSSAEVLKVVSQNLDTLAATSIGFQLEALKAVVNSAANNVSKSVPSAPMALLHKAGDAVAATTESILPKKWTKDLSRNAKIGIGVASGIALVALAAAVFRRGKRSIDAGNDARAKAKVGWLKGLFITTGVAALAFGSWKAYQIYEEVGSFRGMFAKMADGSFFTAMLDKTKQDILDAQKGAMDLIPKPDQKDKQQYGLTDDQKEKAHEMYLNHDSLEDIQSEVFDEAGASEEDFQEWYRDEKRNPDLS